MATSFNKVYTVTVKYSKDDVAAITDSELNAGILRNCLFRPIRPPIPIQSGHLSERSDAGFSLYFQVAGMSQG